MDFHFVQSHCFSNGVIALHLCMPFGVMAEAMENRMTGKGKIDGWN